MKKPQKDVYMQGVIENICSPCVLCGLGYMQYDVWVLCSMQFQSKISSYKCRAASRQRCVRAVHDLHTRLGG